MSLSGATLRLLLVSSHEGCRDTLEEALASKIPGAFQLFWVSLPDVAEKRARELLPHIIFVDDDLSGASPSAIVRRLRQHVPNAACVVVVKEHNTAEAQRAVLEGARAFLVKPVNADDLMAAIQLILEQPTEQESSSSPSPLFAKGKALVFTAPKGGTGRTTLTVNTAISMHRIIDQTAAVVDADFYAPSVDIALNLHSDRTILDLLPRLSHLDENIVMSVMTPHASGVHALLSPPPQHHPQPIPLPQVQETIMGLKRVYPWNFIDLGINIDETTLAFLDSADAIIVNMLPELAALRNARLLLDLFYSRGYPKEKIFVVLNRWDMEGGIPAEDIEKRLHIKISFRIPDDQPLATYALNRGVPVCMSHPNSALAKSYRDFVRFLLKHCQLPPELKAAVEQEEEKRSLRERILTRFRRNEG